MTWMDIETNWQQFEPLVRRHWFRVTQSDLAGLHGERALLARCIAGRYGMSTADAEREIDAWVWMVGTAMRRTGAPVSPERELPEVHGRRADGVLRRILHAADAG
jgi:hypothetical protein